MNIRHILLYLIDISGKKITSKTKIQKQMYFLSIVMKTDFHFKAHYYGPYSPAVDDAIDELIGAGYIDVTTSIFGIDYDRGFEVKRYEYSLTESGKKLLSELGDNGDKQTVRDFLGKLNTLGDPGYLELSIAAKVNFINSMRGSILSATVIKEEAKSLGWRLKKEDITNASNILKEIIFES